MASQRDTRDWLRSTLRAHARQIWSVYGFLLLCSALFWYLRFAYWRGTYEPPFSDIAGYVTTADNIVRDFFFGFDDNHQTYFTPVTPALIAVAKLIAPVRFELAFRVLIQVITFAAALGVVREIALLTGKRWLAASFLFIVAICRPSIFWSLKLSTEPVCEALLYATAATALAALRTRQLALGGAVRRSRAVPGSQPAGIPAGHNAHSARIPDAVGSWLRFTAANLAAKATRGPDKTRGNLSACSRAIRARF